MWDLPRAGLEPMSPALAGGFLTTAPPGKPLPFAFGEGLWETGAGWSLGELITEMTALGVTPPPEGRAGVAQVAGHRYRKWRPMSWLSPGGGLEDQVEWRIHEALAQSWQPLMHQGHDGPGEQPSLRPRSTRQPGRKQCQLLHHQPGIRARAPNRSPKRSAVP